MRIAVVTPPDPVVTVAEAKVHLRVDADDEDDLIAGLVQAAVSWIGGPGGWLGRAVGRQTLRATTFGFGGLMLPFPPIISIEAVEYLDPDGVMQTVDPAGYRLSGRCLVDVERWPPTADREDAVWITYLAGEDPPPPAVKQAILLLIGQWYRKREAITDGAPTELPFAVEALLSSYRVWQ